ncbi:MAG: hypothetical protein ACREC5_08845, partial [Thermoplasmata archaeon]
TQMAEEQAYAEQDWAEGEWVEGAGGEMVWVPAEGGETVTAEAWSQGEPDSGVAVDPLGETPAEGEPELASVEVEGISDTPEDAATEVVEATEWSPGPEDGLGNPEAGGGSEVEASEVGER